MSEQCTIEDLRTHAIMTLYVENGQPMYDEPCYEASQCIGFWCVGCGKDFTHWEEALLHVQEAAWAGSALR